MWRLATRLDNAVVNQSVRGVGIIEFYPMLDRCHLWLQYLFVLHLLLFLPIDPFNMFDNTPTTKQQRNIDFA